MDGRQIFVLISHGSQVALSLYGVACSYFAITKLQGYEETTQKLAKWSSTVEQELHKTRTTQTSGALATLTSLLASLTLLTLQPQLPNWLAYSISPFMLLAVLFARGHIKNYWTPHKASDGKDKAVKVPALPNLEDYRGAQKSTEDLLQVLEWLEYSCESEVLLVCITLHGLRLGIAETAALVFTSRSNGKTRFQKLVPRNDIRRTSFATRISHLREANIIPTDDAHSATGKLDLDKENRPPRGMAVEKKAKGKGTPGRPKKQGNQYFEIGKVGRKTGITLEDKGIRDEHGLEPVSHIFSSPTASPQRNGDKTLTSSDMLVQESSAPDVETTLHARKTPRLPPPRASTPKHTNIGSPKRMSTGRPVSQRLSVDLLANGSPARPRTLPANRVLDFGADTVHKSIEATSPFKPKRTLRRSVGPGAAALAGPSASPERDARPAQGSEEPSQSEEEAQDVVEVEGDAKSGAEEQAPPEDDGPLMVGDDDNYDAMPQQPSPVAEVSPLVEEPQTTPSKRKRGRPRKSGDSITNSQLTYSSPAQGRKRDRTSLEEEEASTTQSQSGIAATAQKKRRGRPSRDKTVLVHQDDGDAAIDPSLLAHGDEYVEVVEVDDDEAAEAADEVPELPTKARAKGKGKAKAPKERDANRKMKSSSVQLNYSPSKVRGSQPPGRGGSVGPVSNVHLRATTPFEDANGRTSRYGRNLNQPLKWWANESRIYKHGELEGIVRADEVVIPKKKTKRRSKKSKKGIGKVDDADEDSETESVMPDEWEEDVGVIAGQIAAWDPATQMGDPENLIKEDIAFASSAIVTRDVANSEFKYAKIMTLPFFGSGIVELPPEGFKRAKNSRKMQMCFFVHEGKVMVEIGAANGEAPNEFAVSKGGAWVVPRGNNYAVSNESRTKTARLFFAQGCEMEAVLGALE